MIMLLNKLSGWKTYLQRLILPIALLILATQVIAAPALATGIYELPPAVENDTWIVDQANTLSRANESAIKSRFKKLADETGNQVRIVTIHRLDYGETPESFANQLFKRWFPTPEAQSNQALLFLDDVTNGVALIAGDQVKAELSDEISESVAEETMMVPLRDGSKYNKAFLDASDRLVAVLSGEPDPGPPAVEDTVQIDSTFTSAEDTDRGTSTVVVVVLLIIATVVPMATYFYYQSP
ncbi:MAG: YgcG family protein [Cyanothece sp. SIO1E1]|nr:YgcG family protein [Cyanothece sp. SIO1E1]